MSNIGPKTLHMSNVKRENRVIYASKSRKNSEKSFLLFFICLSFNDWYENWQKVCVLEFVYAAENGENCKENKGDIMC